MLKGLSLECIKQTFPPLPTEIGFPLTCVGIYLHQISHRCPQIIWDNSQQHRITGQDVMPKKSSPGDLG